VKTWSEHKSLAKAVIAIMGDEGLPATFDALQGKEMSSSSSSQPRTSADVWLRGVITPTFSHFFTDGNEEAVAVASSRMSADLCEARSRIVDAAAFARKVPEALADVSAFVCILEANVDPPIIRATQLKECVARIEAEHFVHFRDMVKGSELWKSIFATASNALQLSAKDSLADSKLKRARSILDDGRLPRLMGPPAIDDAGDDPCGSESLAFVVRNFFMISDGSVFGSYEESIALVSESLSMWSLLRREEAKQEVMEWVSALVLNILFVDMVTSLFLQSVAWRGGLPDMMVLFGSGGLVWPSEVNLSRLTACLDKYSVDELALEDCIRSFTALMKSCSPELQADAKTLVSDLDEFVLKNIKYRSAMVSALSCLATISEVPACPQVVIEDWIAKQTLGRPCESFIEKAMQLLGKVNTMISNAPSEIFDYDAKEGDIRMAWDEGESSDIFVASFNLAASLPRVLAGMPVWAHLRELVHGSIQQAVQAFAQSLHLDVVGPGPGQVEDKSKLAIHMKGFFVPTNVAEVVKACGKIFAPGSNRLWKCCEALELVDKLTKAVPDDEFVINVGCFDCSIASADNTTNTTNKGDLQRLNFFCQHFSKVSCTMAFLCLRFVQEAEPSIRDHKLKNEVEVAISFLRTEINTAMDFFAKEGGHMIDGLQSAVLIDSMSVKAWLDKAKVVVRMLCEEMHRRHVAATSSLASEVATLTPKYEHLITADKINVAMAKKQVLHHPGRKSLSAKVVDLYNSIVGATRLKTQWNILESDFKGSSCEDDVVEASDMDVANEVFKSGKLAITVTAALNVLYELEGDVKEDAIDKLLDSKRGVLPQSLIIALEKEQAKAKSKIQKVMAKAKAKPT
jgi:hypothetical protein